MTKAQILTQAIWAHLGAIITMTKMKPKDKLAKRNVFLDTSIILEGGMKFLSRTAKVANLYVTDIVLQELDGKKNAEGKVGFNAREFYRQFNTAKVEELHELPDGQKLDRRDVIQRMTLPDGLVLHTIHRTPYKTKDINDSKIIEVAKDYKGTLSTIDMAQSVRAKSVGCDAWVVEVRGGGPKKRRSPFAILFGLFFMAFSCTFIYSGIQFEKRSLEFERNFDQRRAAFERKFDGGFNQMATDLKRWNGGSRFKSDTKTATQPLELDYFQMLKDKPALFILPSLFFLVGLFIFILGWFKAESVVNQKRHYSMADDSDDTVHGSHESGPVESIVDSPDWMGSSFNYYSHDRDDIGSSIDIHDHSSTPFDTGIDSRWD